MANFVKLLNVLLEALPYLHKTILFNFKYFKIKTALRFPVLFLSKSTVHLKGECRINSDGIHFGMITIGKNYKTNRPNHGVFINLKKGGILVFNGTANIGRNSSIEVGEKGILSLGDNLVMTYGALIYAYHYVCIGNNCRIGWDTVIMDTAFHALTFEDGSKTKGYAPVVIGNYVWIPSFCRVMAGAKVPDYIVFGSGSYISKDFSHIPPKSLLAGNPLTIKKKNIYRDTTDDLIEYK